MHEGPKFVIYKNVPKPTAKGNLAGIDLSEIDYSDKELVDNTAPEDIARWEGKLFQRAWVEDVSYGVQIPVLIHLWWEEDTNARS